MKSVVTASLLALVQLGAVDAVASFLPTQFNGWWWQSALTVKDRLYIDGGEVYSLTKGGDYLSTIVIDLKNSWTTSTLSGTGYARDRSFASARRPQLFYDESHDMVYSQAGQVYGILEKPAGLFSYAAPQVWGFKPDDKPDGTVTWSEQYSKELTPTYPYVSSVENGLWASTEKKHYSLGGSIGFLFNASDPSSRGELSMNQFLIYDYETQTFENKTHPAHYIQGGAQYVPSYGEEGVLIFFGGKTPTDRNVADDNLADTGIILVYDIHNDKFYNQSATNAPVARFNLCSVGAGNAGNNSYEIFMYGGTTDKNNTNNAVEMSKVFILSLPSFHWIEAPEPADTWRTDHFCETIAPSSIGKHNRRQMVSIGGIQDPSPNGVKAADTQDAWTSGMKVLDLTALTWSDQYLADAKAYERSDVVNKYYNENEGYPEVWGDPALEAIFKTDRSLKVTATPTGTGSNADPTSPGADGSGTGTPGSTTGEKKSVNTGAIAGGVVGGVAGLALVGLAAFFLRRRSQQKDQTYSSAANNPQLRAEGPTEMPVGYKDEPKAELPVQEVYRSELP
ncbi:hypothetical protein V494_00008 [Pseudogymnoascus sp. VKM F-4513 (FW-928)]|nr:hypothetical protein V494_00008 [Pseudogymnoascus sp. VKM F-4513 (FW-928)]